MRPLTLPLLVIGDNPLLTRGIMSLSGVCMMDDAELSIPRWHYGLLVLVPGDASPETRLKMLSVSRSPGWRKVALVNPDKPEELAFAALMGVRTLSVRTPLRTLLPTLMALLRERVSLRRGSGVIGLTLSQWEVLYISLRDMGCGSGAIHALASRTERSIKTLFSQRQQAINRLGLKHIHELRRVVAGMNS